MHLYHALYVVVSQCFLGSYVMLLIDFRSPERKWRTAWISVVTLVVSANVLSLLLFDVWDLYRRFGVLTVTLPYMLITVLSSRHRDFRALFNILTTLFIGCIGTANANLAKMLLPGHAYAEYISFTVRTLSFLVMFFVLRRFASTYRQMLRQLNRSWGILCIFPAVTFFAMLYNINNPSLVSSKSTTVLVYALLIVCGGSYYLMYLFFERVQKETATRHDAQLSALQLSALQSRVDAMQSAEEAIRMERHDLRHRLQVARQLVMRGEEQNALDFLDSAQQRLDAHKPIRWCRPPVLDAMFSSYFDQAHRQGIRVDAKISLPDTLPVEESELAMVIANALENAIHANLDLPRIERLIRCRMIGTPSVVLEIANPCTGDVRFDSNGLPMAQREEHGLGIQSISAFCRKHDAVCRFELDDGWFRLHLIL